MSFLLNRQKEKEGSKGFGRLSKRRRLEELDHLDSPKVDLRAGAGFSTMFNGRSCFSPVPDPVPCGYIRIPPFPDPGPLFIAHF